MATTETEKKAAETTATTIAPEVLTSWRERMGYSQREAALAIGCSRGAWGEWEKKGGAPRYIGLACAALALGMRAYGDTTPESTAGDPQ